MSLSGFNFSIRSKFLLMILSISIVSIGIVGYQGIKHGNESLKDGIKQHLTSLRINRTREIESYFEEKRGQLRVLSENTLLINAMKEFSSAFTLLESYDTALDEKQLGQLESFYKKSFLPELGKFRSETLLLNAFIPESSVARYLQYHYIASNPAKLGEKDLYDQSKDGSYYSKVHAEHHPKLRSIVKEFGFYDLFLINKDSQNIVYTNFKEVDFGTSLSKGRYAQSNLAHITERVINSPDKGKVLTIDFKSYAPSYDAPAAFFAVPIYDKQEFLGVLAAQISSATINRIMSGNNNWKGDGLGETGETYLVGNDLRMRSDSRFLIQDSKNYFSQLRAIGVDPTLIQQIKGHKTSILLQPVDTLASVSASQGKQGLKTTRDYRGVEVLSSFTPLKIPDLRWSLLAEMDMDEVTLPIVEFQRSLVISAVIQTGLITLLSLWLAGRFIRPIKVIADGVKRFRSGDTEARIELNRHDEFGELSKAFNQVVSDTNKHKALIIKQEKENSQLLNNLFPPDIAKRFKRGEKNIADSYSNVAILITSLRGLNDSIEGLEPKAALERLNLLIDAFDEAADIHNVEKITTIGDSYIAACGLSNPRLDYVCRCVDYADNLFEIVDRFNMEYDTEFKLRIGISAGEVNAGVVGNRKAVYDVWGPTVNIANRIKYEAQLNTIRVTQPVYNQLIDKEEFKKCDLIEVAGMGKVATWEYEHTPLVQIQKTLQDSDETLKVKASV